MRSVYVSVIKPAVNSLLESIEEEYNTVKSLLETRESIVVEQEEKLEEIAYDMLPIFEYIKSRNIYFTGEDTDIVTQRGPIFLHDSRKDELYVFDVVEKSPMKVDLYDKSAKAKHIRYRDILNKIGFTDAARSLVANLEHHTQLQRELQSNIDELEKELRAYED
jgi:hypothetical protein